MSLNTSGAASKPTRHTEFYFDDRLIVFQVENTLFKVPARHFSFYSPVFRDMFSLQPPAGENRQGDSDDTPLVLEGEKSADFALMLSCFHRDISGFIGSKENWITLIAMAHKYQMDVLHRAARNALANEDLDPFLKFQLCDSYGIELEWATDAFRSICTRIDPISVTESNTMDRDTYATAVYIREQVFRTCWGCGRDTKTRTHSSIKEEDIDRMIKEACSQERLQKAA